MSNNPISQRIPTFDLSTEEGREAAHRYVASGVVDLNQAIAALNTKVSKLTPTTPGSGSSSSTTINGVQSFNSETGNVVYFPQLGDVNDQRGNLVYTTQTTDNGGKIIVADSSVITITLNASVTAPWFTIIDNDSSGVANLSPSSGALIGSQFIPAFSFGIVYFDGVNWWCGSSQIGRGISPTIVTAALTGGGTQGSMTFSNGILVNAVQAT